MKENSVEEIGKIREILSEFVEYDKGLILRKKLKNIADQTYIQKYSDKEHIDFLNRNEASIKVLHAQSRNHPYYLEMFTTITQHIYADNVRQIIDKAIAIELANSFWAFVNHTRKL